MDIIPLTTQLNLVFQNQDLDLAAVSPVVDATVQHIKVACEKRETSERPQREAETGEI